MGLRSPAPVGLATLGIGIIDVFTVCSRCCCNALKTIFLFFYENCLLSYCNWVEVHGGEIILW